MNLSQAEWRFLQILSDGKKRRWPKIAKELGMIVAPGALIQVKRVSKRLRKMGLVKRVGIALDGYRITDKGMSVLKG